MVELPGVQEREFDGVEVFPVVDGFRLVPGGRFIPFRKWPSE